jgi:hypothetical protein
MNNKRKMKKKKKNISIIRNEKKKKKKVGAGGSACNPSYSGGRNQEDCSSKPAPAMAQGIGPEFKPQYHTH